MSLAQQVEYKQILDDLRNPRIKTTVAHIESTLGIKERTFKRRIKELKDHGYVIRSKSALDENNKKYSYYALKDDESIELPELPIVLSENSYLAFVFMQRILKDFTNTPFEKETLNLMKKVEKQVFSKSDEAPSAVKLIADNITTMKPVLPKIKDDIWPLLIEAIESVQSITFNYTKMDAENQKYTINPYHIFLSDINFQNSWYLAGFVEEKGNFRVFNLSRIENVELVIGNFHTSKRKHPYPFANPCDILWNSTEKNPEEQLLHFKIEIDRSVIMSFKSTSWNLYETYRELDNGNYEMSFKTKLTYNLRGWIMSWGKLVKVIEPQILKEQMRDHIRGMLKNLEN